MRNAAVRKVVVAETVSVAVVAPVAGGVTLVPLVSVGVEPSVV